MEHALEIKAGGISHLTDARYFAAKSVDWVGFHVDPEAGGISMAAVHALKGWVEGPRVIVEFLMSQDISMMLAIAQDAKADAIQLGPFYSEAFTKEVAAHFPVWQEVLLSERKGLELENYLSALSPYVIGFILRPDDTQVSELRWAMLAGQYGIVVHVETADQLAKLQLVPGLRGIELRGSDEAAVGIKSFDALDEVFDLLPDPFA
jgi:phosphoribosylanthranilate isomerase